MISTFVVLSLIVSAEPGRFELSGYTLKTPPVVFETGKPALRPESDAALALVKAYLEEKSYVTTLRVEVHTDSQGADAANQRLSEQRAAAVVTALIKLGVDCHRLIAVGFGETMPIAENSTSEGRARNRRTEFVNAALHGREIGGQPLDGGGVIVPVPCQ